VVGLPFLHPHWVSTVRSVGAGMVCRSISRIFSAVAIESVRLKVRWARLASSETRRNAVGADDRALVSRGALVSALSMALAATVLHSYY
jgi:hypothetical protein